MTELMRLEFLDSSVYMASRNGLTALATKHYIDWQFYGLSADRQKDIFKTNPANNYLYQANNAVIDQSIISIVENIKAEDKRSKLPFTPPDIAALRRHRIVLAHPGHIFFDEPKVQKFFDDREHYRDGKKALRLFRTRESLLNKFLELGGSVKFPNKVTVQAGTVELIHGALSLSVISETFVPPKEELLKSCFQYFESYENAIKNSEAEPKS